VEEGAPDELIARGGWFAQLAEQSADVSEDLATTEE
jgi:ABC-type multidrug transport system fused ATPase/permease subunit